jgi:hypothetical protein
MEMLRKSANYLLGAGLVVTLVIIAVWSDRLQAGYAFQENMAVAAANTVTALLAVTLFVERAMAVFNAILFGDEHRQAEVKLLGADPAEGVKELKNVLGKKERLRLFGSFIAAAFISAAGVRTLTGLLVVAKPGGNSFFLAVDVILTAGLIAGGSNGLAYLLQVIKDMLAPADSESAPDDPADQVGRKRAAPAASDPKAAPARVKYLRSRLMTG